ncbi:hypothetical protein MEX01_45700 [Methylorubrum extorquens]|nr:hypothetical protein MEX01_45700 [Methylorubrum extorquens]
MCGDRRIEIDHIAISERESVRVQIREIHLDRRTQLIICDGVSFEQFADRGGFGHDEPDHGSSIVAIDGTVWR